MGETYADRARGAETLARIARNERERIAFEEIARIWRRLAAGQRVETPAEGRSFEPAIGSSKFPDTSVEPLGRPVI